MSALTMTATGRGRGVSTSVTAFVVGVAVISLAVMQYRWSHAMKWEKPNIVLAQFRGPDGAEKPPVYSAEQMATFAGMLQVAVADAYEQVAPPKKKRWFGPSTEWVMGSSLNELFDGTLVVELKAFSFQEEKLLKSWSLEFASADDFETKLVSSASEIAEGLAGLKTRVP